MAFYAAVFTCRVQGTSSRSESDLLTEAESHGIRLNAFAGREITSVYAKCLSKDVTKGSFLDGATF